MLLIKLTFGIVMISLYSACCNTVDCERTSYSADFRILSQENNTDLLFGPTRLYNPHTIKVFAITQSDTVYYNTELNYVLQDSSLYVEFDPPLNPAYLEFENGDIDTLNIYTWTSTDKCCRGLTKVAEFEFNQSERIENEYPTTTLYK